MASFPAVSIVLPTRNRTELLERAIRSVRCQTFADFELLVVDDSPHSTAQSVVDAVSKNDPRVTYLASKGKGANAARNLGVARSSAHLVAFLDDDDEYLPTKLEQHVRFHRTSNSQASFSAALLVDYASSDSPSPVCYRPPAYVRACMPLALCVYNFVGTQTLMCSRATLRTVGGFDSDLTRYQDWDLALRLSDVCNLAYCPVPLVRIHHHNELRVSRQFPEALVAFYQKHLFRFRRKSVLLLTLLYSLRTLNMQHFLTYYRTVWRPPETTAY